MNFFSFSFCISAAVGREAELKGRDEKAEGAASQAKPINKLNFFNN